MRRCPDLVCSCQDASSEADGNEGEEVREQGYDADVDVAYGAQRREDGAQCGSRDGQVRHDGHAYENSSSGAPLGCDVVRREAEEQGYVEQPERRDCMYLPPFFEDVLLSPMKRE